MHFKRSSRSWSVAGWPEWMSELTFYNPSPMSDFWLKTHKHCNSIGYKSLPRTQDSRPEVKTFEPYNLTCLLLQKCLDVWNPTLSIVTIISPIKTRTKYWLQKYFLTPIGQQNTVKWSEILEGILFVKSELLLLCILTLKVIQRSMKSLRCDKMISTFQFNSALMTFGWWQIYHWWLCSIKPAVCSCQKYVRSRW